MRITYYWACVCGASPLTAGNGRRWFDTESAALDAGKPAKCTNRYCYSDPASPYHTPEYDRPFTVHVIESACPHQEPGAGPVKYRKSTRGALPMGSPNKTKSGAGRPGDPGYVPPRSGRKPNLDELDKWSES